MTDSRIFADRLTRRRALASLAAVVAPLALRGAWHEVARAQEGTPIGTSAPNGPSEEARNLVQSVHPEKIYFYLPGFEDEAVLASVYGLDGDTYDAIRAEFAAAARGAAAELLADASFAERVDRLPFRANAVVVVIGESDTDDLLSWFEILRHALELRRPEDGIVMVNQAISSQSTTEAIGRFAMILGQEPDWILCALGGNDAVRSGLGATKTDVSIGETEKNLVELRQRATTRSEAEWVWLTRWTIDDERIAAYPPFQQGGFFLRSVDFDAVSEVVRRQPGTVIDLGTIFGRPPDPAFLREDGLHPSLAGQIAIARAVVERLATPA